ncbi:putative tubulin tyrosine ligase [Trypanosoma vivax]|nr:putative tubulin tyrosine ligase [Trypanosoma vivax]
MVIPPPPNVPTLYPQSLSFLQSDGRGDTDVMTVDNTYVARNHRRPAVGKFVADPNNDDPSNPKYVPPAASTRSRSRSRSRLPMIPRRPSNRSRSVLSVEEDLSHSDDIVIEDVSTSTLAAGAAPKMLYQVIEPIYPFSSSSLFFPIQYPTISLKSRSSKPQTPGQVNFHYHGADRPHLRLSTLTIQRNNLNRMCLYKLGPGAVAFKVVLDAFEASGMKFTSSNELFNVLWAKRATTYTLSHLGPYQKVNHFPGTWGIGRKDSLATNVHKMQRYFGIENFDIIPMTFIIPRQSAQLEEYVRQNPDSEENPLVFIVKPNASSCGRGIHLCRGMPAMPTGTRNMVCQRYVGNPMLIYGRKFDLRIYCVVTSFDPLRIYLFDEGLVRFAAEKYPGMSNDMDNIQKHLTNYSVNKTAELNRASRDKSYDSDDPLDIKWCLSDLREYLEKNHSDGRRVWDKIMRRCDDVVVRTFLSIESDVVERLRKECRDKTGRGCFELYGLDLMADDQHEVKLIEVNIMPSLATGTCLDKAVKSRMLAHLITLIRVIPHQRNAAPAAQQECSEASLPRYDKRYRFGRHPHSDPNIIRKPLLTHFDDPNEPESILSNEERLMLVESEEELACAGGFRRIFPTAENVLTYLPYFTHGVLRNNYLLASAVRMCARASR